MIIYAHRGYKKKENTIDSFLNSFKYFNGIEFDVRLTKDKIPVVIHDHNLLRTHNIDKIIHLTDYSNLEKYNLPLLLEVLNIVHQYKKKCLIDIKVKDNSQFILNYVKEICKNNHLMESLFMCIVYTDNIVIPPKIKVLRAYNYIIPNNINRIFIGISTKFNGTSKNIESISNLIDKYKNSKFHINLYIQDIPNKESNKFISSFINNNCNNQFSLSIYEKLSYYNL